MPAWVIWLIFIVAFVFLIFLGFWLFNNGGADEITEALDSRTKDREKDKDVVRAERMASVTVRLSDQKIKEAERMQALTELGVKEITS